MKHMCTCGLPIKELYQVCDAIWQKNVFDDKDEGKIVAYGDDYYTWKCNDEGCMEGGEWQDKPKEWPRCEDGSEGCTGYADVIEDETGDGYCASCVDVMAGYGLEEFILIQKQLKEASQ